MDATEPTTVTKHDAIAAHIQPALSVVLDALSSGVDPSWEMLAKLVDESRYVRTRLQAVEMPPDAAFS